MDYLFGFTALVQDVFAPNTVGNLPKTDVVLLRLSLPHPCQNQHTPDHSLIFGPQHKQNCVHSQSINSKDKSTLCHQIIITDLSFKIVHTYLHSINQMPNNTSYHLHVIIIAGLSSNVSGQSPSYTYKSDAIQKQAANTR